MRKTKLLFLIPIFILASCVNDDEKLGLGLMSQEENAIDVLQDSTVNMTAKVFKEDSLSTLNSRYYVLGRYKDDNFGEVSTDIYSQLDLSSSSEDFTKLDIDSAVLTLAINGAFAKDNSIKVMNMQVNVYELSETLDTTKKYAFDVAKTNSSAIFSSIVRVNTESTIKLNNDTTNYAPHIRLKLNSDFVNRLNNASCGSKEVFQEAFKGVKITATNSDNNGMMVYVDMTNNLSGIMVYYHTQSQYSGKYKINFPESGNRFMHVNYNFNGTSLSTLKYRGRFSRKDTMSSNQYIYAGCLGMTVAKISINGLLDWYNRDSIKNSAINSATLILPVADIEGNKNEANYPLSFLCYRKNNDGSMSLIKDELSGSGFYTGKYDKTTNAYYIQISSHLQNYLKGMYPNDDIYLYPDSRRSSANRVILNGPASNNPPKLKITLSHPNK